MTDDSISGPLKALLAASANSPLVEADPKSLDELMSRDEFMAQVNIVFNKDQEECTDDEIAIPVAYYRLNRGKFAKLAKQRAEEIKNKPQRTKSTSVTEAMGRAMEEIEL